MYVVEGGVEVDQATVEGEDPDGDAVVVEGEGSDERIARELLIEHVVLLVYSLLVKILQYNALHGVCFHILDCRHGARQDHSRFMIISAMCHNSENTAFIIQNSYKIPSPSVPFNNKIYNIRNIFVLR